MIAKPTARAQDPSSSAAIHELRRIFFSDKRINALTFHSMVSIFHTIPVRKGRSTWHIKNSPAPLSFSYDFEGKTHNGEDILERTNTNALLIIKDDRIVYERYRNFTGPQTHFLSMSTAKSITSIVVGAAVADGLIQSIDDQVTKYVPELKGSSFDGVTIRNVLKMESGIEFSDNYVTPPDSPRGKFRESAMVRNERRVVEEALTVPRNDPPGTKFRYSTLNTNVLGWVVEKAAGKPLPDYMATRIWQPLGAESGGFFISDGPTGVGRAINGMGFNATLRDYGRLGLMMLHQGKAHGRQILPSSWVRQSTVPDGPEPAAPDEDYGYQFQWWTLPNSNAYTAVGLQGQFIFVDPDTRTVIVKLSYFALGDDKPYQESDAFFQAASAWSPVRSVR